jgi:hypothetical protein
VSAPVPVVGDRSTGGGLSGSPVSPANVPSDCGHGSTGGVTWRRRSSGFFHSWGGGRASLRSLSSTWLASLWGWSGEYRRG